MIEISKPFLPPFDEFQSLMKEVWERNHLTNSGPLSKELEQKLKEYLEVPNFTLVSNGTISLQIAFKAFNLTGEVITTPFSYIATTSSLVWENLKPVFADIKPEDFNIDEAKIESFITKNTSAILATHVFGCPCNLDALEEIARRNNLVLLYDAAHAFGVKYKGKSVLAYGNASSISMHATKLFHTVEGGGLVCQSDEVAYRFSKMRNFGHQGFTDYAELGINAKCSEVHAAFGILNLKYIDDVLERRKYISELYKEHLKDETSLSFQKIDLSETEYNYSYFPVLFQNEKALLEVTNALNNQQIFPRRYFYPSLNTLWFVKGQPCPISEDISQRILCLPLSYYLSEIDVENISTIVKNSIR